MRYKKIITLIIIVCSLYGFVPQSRNEAELIIVPLTFEQHMQQIFGVNAEIATAVLTHESSLKLDAVNYNCRYINPKTGRLYSTFCKKDDYGDAWSVDCGIAQINIKGKTCPPKLLTLEENMKQVEKIYKTQGLNAWVSYKNGSYKKYL